MFWKIQILFNIFFTLNILNHHLGEFCFVFFSRIFQSRISPRFFSQVFQTSFNVRFLESVGWNFQVEVWGDVFLESLDLEKISPEFNEDNIQKSRKRSWRFFEGLLLEWFQISSWFQPKFEVKSCWNLWLKNRFNSWPFNPWWLEVTKLPGLSNTLTPCSWFLFSVFLCVTCLGLKKKRVNPAQRT